MMSLWCLWLLSQSPSQPSVLAELEHVDRQLNQAQKTLNELGHKRSTLARSLAKSASEVAAAKVRGDEAWEQYAKRLRALNKMPGGARLLIFGASSSLSDYLASKRILRWVARHDKRIKDRYDKQENELAHLEHVLETHLLEQDALVAAAKRRRDEMATSRQEKINILESLRTQDRLKDLTRREKAKAREHLSSMVTQMHPRGHISEHFVMNRGRLAWPVNGTVSGNFGRQSERIYGTVTLHSGLDIRAAQGSPVQAIAPGKVVYADWLKGYGQIVIVDHGEQYHSLMAHLSAISVDVGQSVQVGGIVGKVGDTGSLRGTLLYFEIREKGQSVDPRLWLRK
jgi:murein hydrolase activator